MTNQDGDRVQAMAESAYGLRFERTIEEPRSVVWRAWTDPVRLREWYRPDDAWSTPSAEIDLRVGGTYRFALKPPRPVFILRGRRFPRDRLCRSARLHVPVRGNPRSRADGRADGRLRDSDHRRVRGVRRPAVAGLSAPRGLPQRRGPRSAPKRLAAVSRPARAALCAQIACSTPQVGRRVKRDR